MSKQTSKIKKSHVIISNIRRQGIITSFWEISKSNIVVEEHIDEIID